MKSLIFSEIDHTLTELSNCLAAIDQQDLNTVPFEDSWTAGQLVQHLNMSNNGFVELLHGPANDTQRDPGRMVEKIKNGFLDFSTKMKSPEFIVPPEVSYDKTKLMVTLKGIQNKLLDGIGTLDLTKTCQGFELPVFGALTRLEAVNFVLYHTQRHIHQFNKIVSALSDNKLHTVLNP